MYHTRGDIYEDYVYASDEVDFAKFLRDLNFDLQNANEGSVTDMGMRKIIFVNLQRMGFINRYTKDKELCELGKTYRNYRFVKLTQSGLDFLNAISLFAEQRIFRTNSTKKLMFGSYPYPRNFYAQNTTEFISIFVKDGKPRNDISQEIKEESKLSQEEWVTFTKQIWDIPVPNKSDSAFGKHSALMPEAIPYRLIKMFSFVGDLVLDPFAGSGTTLKVAKELKRNFVGYEIYEHYKSVIEEKLHCHKLFA